VFLKGAIMKDETDNLPVNNIKCPDCGSSISLSIVEETPDAITTRKFAHYTAQGFVLEQIKNSEVRAEGFKFGTTPDCKKCQTVIEFDEDDENLTPGDKDAEITRLRQDISDLVWTKKQYETSSDAYKARTDELERILREFADPMNWDGNIFKGVLTRPRVTGLQLANEAFQ
jgi:hypothetical protein